MIRLGVNIDHVATVRNARGEAYPDPVYAANLALSAGAENITFHLREDRRHIRDEDVWALKKSVPAPLNMELALRPDVVEIALKLKPHSVTFVPERRQEVTTEGGLNVSSCAKELKEVARRFRDAGVLVSLFIEPSLAAVEASADVGAAAVEFHTGSFCKNFESAVSTAAKTQLLKPLQESAKIAHQRGMQVHLGHGINYLNANWMQHVEYAEEANVGHAIVAEALFVGFVPAVQRMKALLNDVSLRPNFSHG